MKKLVAVIMLVASVVVADEWYRPVYGGWTNTSVVWTNNIDAVVMVKNVMLRAGTSNQTFSVDAISGLNSNRLIAPAVLGAGSNSAPIELYYLLEMGDSLKFNSSAIDTTGTNKYTLILQKNVK